MSASFLLDEHLPKWWRRELLRQAPHLSLWRVGEMPAPPLGSPDPVLLEWCEAQAAFLLTNNRASMPTHLQDLVGQGRHVPGIFVVHPAMNVLAVAEELLLIEGASLREEYRDQVNFMPLT